VSQIRDNIWALLGNTSLTSLDLCNNNIGDEGAKALADALLKNTSLTSLDLGHNNIGSALTNVFERITIRNDKYIECNLKFQMFFDSANIPNELNNIINNSVLAHFLI
jgi:Leucine-rich repeat (LRR) protein